MVSLRSFVIKLGIFSVFTSLLPILWQSYASERFRTSMGWYIWTFFIVATLLIHFVLMKAASESPKKFVIYFMGITGIKLFLYLIIIMVYGIIKGKAALGFVLLFLIFYFLYTTFEIVTLMRRFKK